MGIDQFISDTLTQWPRFRIIEITGVALNYLGNGDSLAFICLFLMIVGYMAGKAPWIKSGASGLLVLSASGIIVGTLKHLFGRARPHLELGDSHFIGPSLVNTFDSMPSGHSMASFTLASFYSTLYPHLKIPLYMTAGGIAIIGRVFLGHHFLSDVIVGGVLGTLLGQVSAKKFTPWIQSIQKHSPERSEPISTPLEIKPHKQIWIISAVSLLILMTGLGSTAYWDRDESEHTQAVLEMEKNQNWLTPTIEGKPFLDKPIFIYWTTRLSHKLFGSSEWSTRLPSVLFGILSCIAVFYLGRGLYGGTVGFYSSLILATCPLFAGGFRLLLADPPFIFFSILSFALYVQAWKNPNKSFLALPFAYVSIGISILARGPLALFPLPVFIAHEIKMSNESFFQSLWKSSVRHAGLLLIALALAAPWFLYSMKLFGSQNLIFGDLYRFLNITDGHRGPLFFYVIVLGLGCFPWTFFLYPALKKDWQSRMLHKNKIENETFLLLSWFFSVFVLTSLCATKLLHFILPTLPPLCCLVGKFWSEQSTQPTISFKKYSIQSVILSLTFIIAIGSLMILLPELTSAFLMIPFIILTSVFLGAHRINLNFTWKGFMTLCTGMVLFFTSFSVLALPRIEQHRVMKPIGLAIKELVPPSSKVMGYFISEPSLSLYSERSIPSVEDYTIDQILKMYPTDHLIVEESRLKEQTILTPYTLLKRKEGFAENGGKKSLLLITNKNNPHGS